MFCSLLPFFLRYDSTGGGGVSKRDFGNESCVPNSFPPNAADEFQPVAESASIAVDEFHPVDLFPPIAADELHPVSAFPSGAGVEKAAENVYHAG
ncbi:MAG: hypothetical protein K2H73_09270 [Treponemataceae bacterium]|nr:hypothetical protein [Treponemataceae bacterium]